MSAEPRAKTAEELRDEFMDSCRSVAEYWATVTIDNPRQDIVRQRLQGALHSFLCIIDGVSGSMPLTLDLVARPHPDDKAYAQEEGENWVEDGTVINDTMLHELLCVPGRTDAWGKAEQRLDRWVGLRIRKRVTPG